MTYKSIALANVIWLCACVGYRTPLDDLDSPKTDAGRRFSVIPCVSGSTGLTLADPTVMFVIDRSASMNDPMGNGPNQPTRWEALGGALASVLPSVNDTLAIGALIFPATGTASLNCSVASKADLMPSLGNVPALVRLMSTGFPEGATPTASALDTAATLMLGLRTATGARALVLATDGGPNCNADLNILTCRCTSAPPAGSGGSANLCSSSSGQGGVNCLDDARTEETISKYHALGLPTYVIGIQSEGDTQFSDVLDAMAVAGGRPRQNSAHNYYAATSQAELTDALTTIRDQVGACTFLTTSMPDLNGSIVINLDGAEIPAEQWIWGNKDNGEIILLGDACQTVVAEKQPTVKAVVQCTGG
jgi:hypothetical protein